MIIVGTALVNNVVLSQFLGICSFLGVSKQMKASLSLGGAVIFVITIASAVASLLYTFVLSPLGLTYLKTIVFILVIAALVQMVEMFLKKNSPAIYKALGIYLPLITTNCAVLGVALTNVQNGYNFLESVLAGFGTAAGFTIAITLLAGIRSRLDESAVPVPFRGAPLVLLSAALMATGRKFCVETDPREAAVRECLPGNNCGACGFAGCDAVAAASAKGEAPAAERRVAFVRCGGDCEKTSITSQYVGVTDCRAAALAGLAPLGPYVWVPGIRLLQLRRHPCGQRRGRGGSVQMRGMRPLCRCLPEEPD